MAFDCMDDCIHLKACRRVQKIGKTHRLLVPRYCTEDCTAYEKSDERREALETVVAALREWESAWYGPCGNRCDLIGNITEAYRVAKNTLDAMEAPHD